MNRSCMRIMRSVLQTIQFLVGLTLLAMGFTEFFSEPPLFDILGEPGTRPSLPDRTFNNESIESTNYRVFGRVMDLPVLSLFVTYFLGLIWLKFKGHLSWIMTGCMVVAMLMIVGVNKGLANGVLEWRFMSQRASIIVLDVLILSFGWTAITMVLLLIRGWFPFKTMKTDPVTRSEKAGAIIGNIIGLYSVLTLCFFIWFTRLYVSWACIDSSYDFLLLCQLTNQIQCYSCNNVEAYQCVDEGLAECVKHPSIEPFHCLSPSFTMDLDHKHGFCVFNYNIGFFTFVTVFAYVGGIYFFCRTIFKAILKCMKVIILILIKYCHRLIKQLLKKKDHSGINEGDEENSLKNDRVSLLASLPKDYASTANSKTASTNMV